MTLPIDWSDHKEGDVWSVEMPLELGYAAAQIDQAAWFRTMADGRVQLRLTVIDNSPEEIRLYCLHLDTVDPWQRTCANFDGERTYTLLVWPDEPVLLHLHAGVELLRPFQLVIETSTSPLLPASTAITPSPTIWPPVTATPGHTAAAFDLAPMWSPQSYRMWSPDEQWVAYWTISAADRYDYSQDRLHFLHIESGQSCPYPGNVSREAGRLRFLKRTGKDKKRIGEGCQRCCAGARLTESMGQRRGRARVRLVRRAGELLSLALPVLRHNLAMEGDFFQEDVVYGVSATGKCN